MPQTPIIKNSAKPASKSRFGGSIGALLATGLGVMLLLLPVGKLLRDSSYDLTDLERVFPTLLARAHAPKEDVRIVFLDEKTYSVMKQEPAAFDRSLHAMLIRKLKAAGAKMIVFDVLFIDSRTGNTNADNELALAMHEQGRVIIGGDYHEHTATIASSRNITPPLDIFRDACAGWGLVKIDSQTVARIHHPGTEQVPSLSWQGAKIVGAGLTNSLQDRFKKRWLNYYSDHPFVGVSFSDVLDGNTLPTGFFKDKTVFVGAGDVAGYGDGEPKELVRTPWTWRTGESASGVVVHAITFENLIHGDWLWRMPDWLELNLIIAIGLVLGFGLSSLRPLAATGAACAFCLAVAGICFLLFLKFNLWFPWLVPVAVQAPAALLWAVSFQSVKSYLANQLLETSLALYVGHHQAREILKKPELLKPGGRIKTVAMVFTDIEGFSKYSETTLPDELVELLNRYYETAIECIHRTDGTIMNLIGDAIFAIWNAPQAQADAHDRACNSALMLSRVLNSTRTSGEQLPFRTRIGLHAGEVCVGNIGSSTHVNFTAIGSSVNLASRVEGLNKQLGTNILMTGSMKLLVGSRFTTRGLGRFRFNGFDNVTEIHELISTVDEEGSSISWRRSFEAAVACFQNRQLAEAKKGFQETLQLNPADGPSRFYLAKITELESRTIAGDWGGEINLDEK